MLNIIFIVLSVLWSLGCLAGFGWIIHTIWDDYGGPDWWAMAFAFGVGLPIVLLFAVIPWGAMAYASSPDLVTLKKAEWECINSHSETTYVKSGDILVPVTSDICDVYGRK